MLAHARVRDVQIQYPPTLCTLQGQFYSNQCASSVADAESFVRLADVVVGTEAEHKFGVWGAGFVPVGEDAVEGKESGI